MSQTWIEKVMSKIMQNLESDGGEKRYEYSKIDRYLTSLYNVSVIFKNKEKDEKLSLILKRPLGVSTQIVNINFQFHNEILFYRAYAKPNENLPRCFYFDKQPPTDSVIALENVSDQGYCPCSYVYNAPLEYLLAAMRELGRFHGKGYVMKELQREKFFDIVKQLQETKYPTNKIKKVKDFYNIVMRVVYYLRSQNYDTAFCDKMTDLFSNTYDKVFIKILKPAEPLSTLCHGDYTLSNNLFKMEDNGQLRAMLIDFADLKYATPVVDLSIFLCLSSSNELIKNKFFEIMRAYHDALKEYLTDAGIWDADKYSYDAFLDNFRRGAIFGFVVASFFLPILMGYSKLSLQMIINRGYVESVKESMQSGGDKMSKILADMLLHLKDLGCLEHFL